MNLHRTILWVALMVAPAPCMAQADSSSRWQWSGYAEAYLMWDMNRPPNRRRPDFFYNHTRHADPRLNLAYVKGSYEHRGFRAALALIAGTYSRENLAAEPRLLRHVFEAGIGIKLHKKHDWWLDAGVFPSHIGFETAVGSDCITLSRSLAAENSPYYEAGIKTTYKTPAGKWTASLLLLRGWQRIARMEGNSLPALGTQVQFTPKKGLLFNHSTFIGSNEPDSLRRMRYFQNFYALLELSRKTGLVLGFDIGCTQTEKHSRRLHTWLTPVAAGYLKAGDKTTFALRAEYYRDRNQVIISGYGPSLWGFSFNADRALGHGLLWRVEWRHLASPGPYFLRNGTEPVIGNMAIATSLSVKW